jgi:hypothetical protein
MSIVVKVKTQMKDAAIAQKAAAEQGISTRVDGGRVYFDSGKLRGAYLDIRTGELAGDQDHVKREDLRDCLTQGYAVHQLIAQTVKEGGELISRTIEGDDVVLKLRRHG